MRLDKFLKVSRIIKRRTIANEACDAGRVTVNGKVAKASVDVKVGDEIEIKFGTNTTRIRVLNIVDSTKKEDAANMYESFWCMKYLFSIFLIIIIYLAKNKSVIKPVRYASFVISVAVFILAIVAMFLAAWIFFNYKSYIRSVIMAVIGIVVTVYVYFEIKEILKK